ncbi:DUF5916 domain-containing protein [Mesoterricola sediminis]|uniref:DUF5916 domain-containing protein n=1 Tax=Mesoterricola sediminis TaxID=2927980 RepID=A0AA48H3W6_9BACT|nr:DUF5916 domain-containing protein [Mesoterricola sediminis]BDU75523.1 hypothetical protein METESE_04810 [Mesoterricola sediminis]
MNFERSRRWGRWVLAGALLGALAGGLPLDAGLIAIRARGPIRPDGRMAEPDWDRAPAATGFKESWPEFGLDSALPTYVKVLYDDNYLYVGARMDRGAGNGPARRLHRRDQDSQTDWFSVYIDSRRDRRTAFGFMVNAAGVQRDAIFTGDSSSADASWDAVWESGVRVDDRGWTAVLKIPLSALRMANGSERQVWGINFSRTAHGSVRETSYWDLPPRGENAFASRFPDLEGIEGVRPRLRREWIPFLSLQRKASTANVYDDRGWKGNTGLDAHLGLSPSASLDLAVRPDFAQVEVDQAVLNLSTVETLFPEKRPFFLEGMELFQVPGTRLFYSRRIGRSLASPDLEDGQTLLEGPATAEIAGAAKFTSKLDNGLSFGALAAGVENARGTVREADGSTHGLALAPFTSYAAFRGFQRLDEVGSGVGVFASRVREADPAGRSAFVGEADGALKSRDRSTVFEWSLAGSRAGVHGEEASGSKAYVRVNRRWASGWQMEFNADNTTKAFNPNDLGYLSRADQQRGYFSLVRQWDTTLGRTRNWQLGADVWYGRDQAGRAFSQGTSAWARMDLTTFWSFWGSTWTNLPLEDDRELRTWSDPVKKYLRRPRSNGVNLGFDTPGNRPWYVRISADRSWYPGGPTTTTSWSQSIKLGESFEVNTDTSWVQAEGEQRYLETQGTIPVVGLRRMSQFNETVRVAYAFNPRLSVQVLSQWLLANWNFRDTQAYVDDETLAPAAPAGDTAFSDRLWNENLIVRWEFKAGSTLFFVYTHGVATDALVNDRGSLSPRSDISVLGRLPSDDVFLVKLSWLFR